MRGKVAKSIFTKIFVRFITIFYTNIRPNTTKVGGYVHLVVLDVREHSHVYPDRNASCINFWEVNYWPDPYTFKRARVCLLGRW